MAQIIKHRRGSIDALSGATAKKGELVMATGSVGNMQGPWIFVGETEGSAGAFRGLSKIYQGTTAPDLTVGTWGSTLNGTPFYGSTNQSLHILSNAGNTVMDLTGNIEGNVINSVTINTLSGNTNLIGDLLITGNTFQTGSITLTGDVTLRGNINIGDNLTGDTVTLNGEISSSLIPAENNTFDLGSTTNAWKDLYVSGTAYVENINIGQVSLTNLALPGNLTVSGTTTLSGSVFIEDLTDNRIVIAGSGGQLEDDVNFTFNGTQLNIGQGKFTIQQGSGNINTLGTLNVSGATILQNTLTVDGASELKGAVGMNSTLDVTGSANLKNNLSVSGTTNVVGATTLQNTLTVNSTSELKGAVGINSTLDVTGSAQFKSTINVDGEATLASATVEDLTQDRIVTVGAGGSLIDSSGFTYNGSLFKIGDGKFEVDTNDGDIRTSGSLTIQNGITINGNQTINGALTVTGNTIINSNLYVSGNVEFLATSSYVHISSSIVELDDNIIRLNAYSPFERYAGFEVMDSGSSGVSGSILWDSLNDYWMFVSGSGQSSKIIGTTTGAYGSEVSLTSNTIPKATGTNTIGDSLLTDNATTLAYNTNKFTVTSSNGATLIAGNVTLSASGGSDGGANSSAIVFRNSSNVLGYVPTAVSTVETNGLLGYRPSSGQLIFSDLIDGGTYD